jgi:hypothetical protein
MKAIKKEELYRHVGRFLKSKGIELSEGSYTRGIHAGCSLLADAINMSQNGLERARRGLDKTVDRLDKTVDQVRQTIHEKTAPTRTTTASTGVPPIIVQAGKTTVKATKKAKAPRPRPKPKKTRSQKGR